MFVPYVYYGMSLDESIKAKYCMSLLYPSGLLLALNASLDFFANMRYFFLLLQVIDSSLV